MNPFRDFLEYLTQKLVLAGTSGQLTMLSAPGSGTLAGGAHTDTFQKIAKSEGRKISEIFQKQRDTELLDLNFPGRPRLAYFELCINEENDVKQVVLDVASLATAGLQVDPEQVTEKTGYSVTLKPAAPAQPGFNQPPIVNRAQNEMAQALGVKSDWLKPIDDLLAELEAKADDKSLTDADLIKFLEEAVARVPELFKDMDIDALAAVMENDMAGGLAQGIKAALNKKTQTV
jgi:phage gp29-like protein